MRSIKLSPGRQLAAAEGRGALLLPMPGLGGPRLPARLPRWRGGRRGKGVLWQGSPAKRNDPHATWGRIIT